MVEVSQFEVSEEQALEELKIWYTYQQQLADLKPTEITMRKRIARVLFKTPKEGANTLDLGDGYEVVMYYNIDRDVDVAALSASGNKLRKAKIDLDALVVYKPEISVKEYRKLTDKQRALFDACLTIKPGAPGMMIRAANAPRIGDEAKAPAASAPAKKAVRKGKRK